MENKRRARIYIASPYTNGDKEQTVQLQMAATYHLLKMGFNPYMPIYHHFVQKVYPDLDHSIPWLAIDKEWLMHCDMAVRLHPKDKRGIEIGSPGADEEQDFCEKNNILMLHFETVEEMVQYLLDYDPEVE